jgi:SpoVK/Ycf46/Vps4 family AAA+-type ATPase
MNTIDFNSILERNKIASNIKSFLEYFQKNKKQVSIQRGIYIYGTSGSGKTFFVKNLLETLGYDIILYDSGDFRNKQVIDAIKHNNMSDINVLSLLTKKSKPLVIIMDEIDAMNNGDKGGINTLIKLIRPKKTKKQRLEEISYIPIICIGNNHVDKKITELIKVCYTIELPAPTNKQITKIIESYMPNIFKEKDILIKVLQYIQNDLGLLFTLYKLYINDYNFNSETMGFLMSKNIAEDTKDTVKKLINKKCTISNNNDTININDADRTIIGLLWHENIIEQLNYMDKKESIKLYIKLLDNICEADYIDRITFQKQIWQFNEMSFLIKIFYNNLLFKEMLPKCPDLRYIRFTKVLTKYSNEYNNQIFLQNLSHILFLDKKDVFSLFIKLQKKYSEEQIYTICKAYDISKLDVNRIYRYIDKFDDKLKTNSQPSQPSQPSHTNAEYIQDTKYIKYTQVNEVNEEFQENEDIEYNEDAEDN